MRKFPVVSGKKVVAALKTAGFQEVSQKGGHIKLKGLWDDRFWYNKKVFVQGLSMLSGVYNLWHAVI